MRKRVLITRAAEQAHGLADGLERAGFEAVRHPAIAFESGDLSPVLEALSEAAQTVDFRSPPDEIKRAIDHDSRVRPNRRGVDREVLREPAGHIGGEPTANVKKLMPKGRNFH